MAIVEPPALPSSTNESTPWRGEVTLRWPALFLVLGAVYMALWFISSPDGHLITDTGGKAATLEAMSLRGDWDPDLGYWFAEQDPDGQFHPIDHTLHTDNGTWVNTTSLTMIYLMKPLYELGGPRLAVLLVVVGGFLCALSAAALERRFDPTADGKLSFLLVGLSSSVVVYTSDIWEHTLGLAAIAYGAVRTIDAIEQRRPVLSGLLAGLMFGFAATMRQEALVYGFVAGVALLVLIARRESLQKMVTAASAMVFGTLLPMAIHTALEIAVLGGPARLQRSAGTASSSANATSDRLDAAFITTINLLNLRHPIAPVLGVAFLAVGAFVIHRAMRGESNRTIDRIFAAIWVIAILAHARRFSAVPAMFVATPLAMLGAVSGVIKRSWLPLAIGLAPVPLVLLTQFTEGHMWMWGGRYLLASALILTVLAVTLTRRHHTELLTWFALGSLVVTAYAVPWAEARIDTISHGREALHALTDVEELVVWTSPTLAREFGTSMFGRRWLAAEQQDDRDDLALSLQDEGFESFVLIVDEFHPSYDFPGYAKTEDRGAVADLGFVVQVWEIDR